MQASPTFIQAASRDLENGICMIDYRGNVDWNNMTFTQFFGYSLDEVQQQNMLSLLRCEQSASDKIQEISAGIESGTGCSGVKVCFAHLDKTLVDVYVNIIPVRAGSFEGHPMQYVVYMRQVKERGHTSMVTKTCQHLFDSVSPVLSKDPVS